MPAQRMEVMDFDSSWPGKSDGAPDPRLGTVETRTTVPVQPAPPKVDEEPASPIPQKSTLPLAPRELTQVESDRLQNRGISSAETESIVNRNGIISSPNSEVTQYQTPLEQDRLRYRTITSAETEQIMAGNGLDAADAAKKSAVQAAINDASTIPDYKATANPLRNYASYTYSLSLHALTPNDYNTIMGNPEEDYRPKAVLIASAGRYGEAISMKRHAEFADVDFFFDNLNIETVIGLTAQTRNTNAISTSFTIIEPYGVTLLNRIMAVCADIGGENFREMPYLLQIDFYGSQDDGIPSGKIPGLTKMIPIRFAEFKIKLSTKGAEYAITAFPFNHTAYTETIASTPTKMEVIAATVGDFFLAKTGVVEDNTATIVKENQTTKLAEVDREITKLENARLKAISESRIPQNKTTEQLALETRREELKKSVNSTLQVRSYTGALNAWHRALEYDGKVEFAHMIAFEIDSAIATAWFPESKFIAPADLPMSVTTSTMASAYSKQGSQEGDSTRIYSDDPRTRVIPLNQGTSIIEVIGLVIRSSSYITDQLHDPVDLTATPEALSALHKKELKWFKITPRVTLLKFDKKQNAYAKLVTYKIEQYKVYNTKSNMAPQGLPQGFVKQYNYMYTGLNEDVISLDINFDSLYYVARTTAAINTTATSGAQNTPNGDESKVNAQEKALTADEIAADKKINANPGFQTTYAVQNTTTNVAKMIDKDDKARQTQQQILTSPSGDMLSIKLKIVGDPDFIKQDDCFYSTKTLEDNKKAGYKFKNGSLVMDLGEIFVNLTFRTPGDYDDTTGLARPGYAKYNSSIFSGRYKVLTVKNTFSGGKFEQELDLIYYPNQDTVGNPAAKPVATTDQRNTAVPATDTRTDPTATVSTEWVGPTMISGSPGSVVSDDYASDPGPSSNDVTWTTGKSYSDESVLAKANKADKELFTAMPTLPIGSNRTQELNASVANATANLPAINNEKLTGLAKMSAMPIPAQPSTSPASNLINRIQSSTSTAAGDVKTLIR